MTDSPPPDPGAIAALAAATVEYQRSWWRADPHAQRRCAADPVLELTLGARRLVDTKSVHFDSDRELWSDERRALHASLVHGQLGDAGATRGPQKRAYFTIGPMGAGKSSTLRQLVHEHRTIDGRSPAGLSRVAADEVRIALPEYADGLGSNVVAIEAYEVTYDLVYPRARDLGADLVYDTIGLLNGDEVSFQRNLVDLQNHGYEIHVLLADCPLEVCVERCTSRALTDGRIVAPEVQYIQHEQPRMALRRLLEIGLVQHWAVVNTSGPSSRAPIGEGSASWLGNTRM